MRMKIVLYIPAESVAARLRRMDSSAEWLVISVRIMIFSLPVRKD